jgi:transcriptional regulator with XRE-family HTH domain
MTRHARRQLASRLRELRESAFEVRITQDQLAAALGGGKPLSSAAISTWENGEIDKRPTETRIIQYALVFSTPRSLEPSPHTPTESKLDKSARARFHELRDELLELREGAEQEARRARSEPTSLGTNEIWHHDRAEKLFVVAPELPATVRADYAQRDSPNYVRLARYADLDAFFEMFVALTRMGYHNLSHRSAGEGGIGSARNLVLIGGPSWNVITRGFMHLLRLPISQRLEPSGEPDFFTKSDGSPALPTVLGQGEQVVEDVGLFVRATNPNDPETDVTICSGVFTHGVLGAVRTFTNPHVAGENAEAVRERLGRLTNFAVLFRVNVIGGRVATPRLSTAILDCVALD